jgi:hypothetical protein
MRRDGWEQRLADVLTDAQTRAFAYGAWDCCLFACAAIGALTGTDPAASFRGRYTDEDSCASVLNTHGGILSIAERAANTGGFARITPREAQRGDVVLGRIHGRATLGVCAGVHAAFAMAPSGLYRVPITDPALVLAWRIA